MKKTLLTIIAIVFALITFAQPPEFFNYQAVVRDAEGNIVASQDVSFKIEILSGSASGAVVYRETHLATTTDQGLVNLKIFDGTVDGSWSAIDWSAADYFIKIYLGNSTGTDFTEMGTSQLLSVPYAMHAGSVNADKLPTDYEKLSVTDTLRIGSSGINIGSIIEVTGTTDASVNYVTIDLPYGYSAGMTRVLSLIISPTGLFLSRYYYGLGYSSAGGTVGYRLYFYRDLMGGGTSNTLTIYYPDELRDMAFKATLMKVE